MLEMHKISSFD